MKLINNTLGTQLSEWYRQNKRSLPWRDTGNAYDVWLSEIMLQQTRIEAVKPKFHLFKETFPTIEDLSKADDDLLLRVWEGLGYYSRARNLKKCAQILVDQYNGELPEEYDQLIKLPGIGPYTAGAITSIAYHKPHSAVDGNVLRIFARLFEITDDIRDTKTKDTIQNVIDSYLKNHPEQSSDFNQGCMELGEVICVPNGNPKCDICPIHEFCLASIHHKTEAIPYRSPLNKRKIINRTLLIIRDGDHFLVHKRERNGLLAGMYEFIGIDSFLTKNEIINTLEKQNIHPLKIKRLPDAKHIFTHLEWHMHAYEITVEQIESIEKEDYMLFDRTALSSKAIPSAFKKYKDYYALR